MRVIQLVINYPQCEIYLRAFASICCLAMTQRLMFVPSLTVGHAHNDRWGYSEDILMLQSYKGGRNFTGLILG